MSLLPFSLVKSFPMATLEELTNHPVEMASLSPQGRPNEHKDQGEEHTRDGSVDHCGKPARRDRTGGWPSGLLLLANQALAMVAFVGVEVNLVLFSMRVLKQSNAEAANTFSRWMGTSNLFSLIGAFLSDAYLGRYLTCVVFQVILTLGICMLSLTTSFLLLKPIGCGKVGLSCNSHSSFELAMFYISIYLVALGNGAYEPSLATFGSDQFDEEHADESIAKQSFYSYFYVATNLGSLLSETVLAYLQNSGKWSLGFWIATSCALLACIIVLSGSMRYRHFKPCGNPLSRFYQVVFAAWKKSAIELPLHEDGLYEMHGKDDATHGGRKIPHSKGFRFLDHAAIITSHDMIIASEPGSPLNPWQICTITQVEEVKCVLRLLPIWLCTIFFSVIFVQMASLFVEQGAAMKTTISNFHIPPASMTIFDIISISAFIIFYNKLIVSLYTKVTKTVPKGPSDLKKMGIGLMLAIFAMITAGITELQRLKHAEVKGTELSSLSILWQIPQYILIGVSEAFVYVGQLDFFSSQSPDGLKSLGIGLCMFSNFLGSYLCSFILTVVMKITTRDGRPGWIPSNLNEGHMDRFFFLMAALTIVELFAYTWCARHYKCISLDGRNQTEEIDKLVP